MAQMIRPNVHVSRELWAEVRRDATREDTTPDKIMDRILRRHYVKDDAK